MTFNIVNLEDLRRIVREELEAHDARKEEAALKAFPPVPEGTLHLECRKLPGPGIRVHPDSPWGAMLSAAVPGVVHAASLTGLLCGGPPGAVVSQRELVTCPECLKALEAK